MIQSRCGRTPASQSHQYRLPPYTTSVDVNLEFGQLTRLRPMLPDGVRMDSGRSRLRLTRAAHAPAVVMIRLACLGDVDALRTIAVAVYGSTSRV
jgi:hypothetical protein